MESEPTEDEVIAQEIRAKLAHCGPKTQFNVVTYLMALFSLSCEVDGKIEFDKNLDDLNEGAKEISELLLKAHREDNAA